MSGESSRHMRLVEKLIAGVRERHAPARGLMMFADHYTFGRNRPPQIGGFTPDLFAHDLPMTFHVIGEAKTPDDLETDRSLRQIRAFLDHLALYPGGSFYLAVPWYSAGRASLVLNSLRQPLQAAATHIRVILGS